MSTLPAASFGALLRHYRLAASLTQEALAERAGLSRAAITTLERGIRRAPRQETIELLADALELSEAERALLHRAARGGPTLGASARAQGLTPRPEGTPL